jgi:TolB protein
MTCIAMIALAGCTTSVSMRPKSGSNRTAGPSMQSLSAPNFSSQHKPVVISGSHSSTTTPSALVSLYGELQTDWQETAGGPWDGSSNVAQITFATEGACSDPDISRDGRRLVFASTQHSTTADIYFTPVPGRTLTQLTTDPADDIMPSLHPMGEKIAFASNRAGNWDIYVMSTDGGQPMKVTDEPEHELHPSWSPDGRHLIYCKLGSRSGRWEMWVVDTNNPGVRRFLDYGLFPQWCPDVARSKILFQRARQRGSRYFSVWTIDYVNGDAVHPTEIVSAGNAAVINPSWSPDGSRVIFVTVVQPDEGAEDSISQSDVWLVSIDGSGRTNLTNGRYANYQPVWGADGRVFFVSDRTGVDNIWSVSTSRAMGSLGIQRAPIMTVTPGDYDVPAGQP